VRLIRRLGDDVTPRVGDDVITLRVGDVITERELQVSAPAAAASGAAGAGAGTRAAPLACLGVWVRRALRHTLPRGAAVSPLRPGAPGAVSQLSVNFRGWVGSSG
jgi:hypothetical protein